MSETVDPELPRGIALAWGVAANPQRGPKREMSVERIVEAAVEIADADGLGAVSMAAVAARLGFTPMSLYRYVSAKDDLILLMQEEATGLPPEQTGEGDWRTRLTSLYSEQLQNYLRHPWVLDIPISGSPATPNSAAWMDAGLHALAETPLSHTDRLAVMLLVAGHARWAGMIIAGYSRAQAEGGLAEADVTAHEDAMYRLLITADAYPELRAAIDAGVFLDDGDPFRFGLERGLDGVAAYMADVGAGRTPERTPWAVAEDAAVAADKKLREARKAVREAEKALRAARKLERQALREARERATRHPPAS